MKILKIILSSIMIIFTTQLYAANYYWVGGTGDWSDFAVHWATSSGGGTFHTQVPISTDNVFFDANSFNGNGQTVTINTNAVCGNMDWTNSGATFSGAVNGPSFTGTLNIEIFGSLIFDNRMRDVPFQGTLRMLSTGSEIIDTKGVKFTHFTYNTKMRFENTGTWTFLSSFYCIGAVEHLQGTVNLGATSHTFGYYLRSGNLIATMNLNSSTITLVGPGRWAFGSPFWQIEGATNYTLNSATSTIILDFQNEELSLASRNQNRAIFYGGNLTYNNIISTANTNLDFRDNNTINKLIFNGKATVFDNNTILNEMVLSKGFEYVFQGNSVQTFATAAKITALGDCQAYVYILSESLQSGRPGKFNHASNWASSNLNFAIIFNTQFTPASINANNSINNGQNSGIVFTTPAATSNFWIGGDGVWNDATHWSTGCVPTPNDNVFFNASSFSAPGQKVTISKNAYCKNMDWTGSTNNPELTSTGVLDVSLNVHGSLKFIPAMIENLAKPINFWGSGAANQITSAGQTFKNPIYFKGTGTYTLQDALEVAGMPTDASTGVLYLNSGTLTTNNQPVKIRRFRSDNFSVPRTINMGNSIFTINNNLSDGTYDNYVWYAHTSNITVNAGTSTINVDNDGNLGTTRFRGGNGFTYYNLNFLDIDNEPEIDDENENTSFRSVSFAGNGKISSSINITNTVGSQILFAAGKTYKIVAGKTINIGANALVIANGTCELYISFESTTTSPSFFSKTSGAAVSMSYVTLKNISAGTVAFTANPGLDLGGNTGWSFVSPAPRTLYWVGGTGNWNNSGNWSLSSGGASGACPPTLFDDVNFDANSFSAAGQSVTINVNAASCKSMNWTGATNNPSLISTNPNELSIYGSLTLINNMDITNFRNNVNFKGTGLNTITSAGQEFRNSYINFNSGTGTYTMNDDFKTTQNDYEGRVHLVSGTLNTNGMKMLWNGFNAYQFNNGTQYNNPRTLILGNSSININGRTIDTDWDARGINLTINAGTSSIFLPARDGGTSSMGDFTYNNITTVAYDGAGSRMNIEGNSTFNDLRLFSNTTIIGNNMVNDTMYFYQGNNYTYTAGTTQNFSAASKILAIGTSTEKILIQSSTTGAPVNFIKPAGVVCTFNANVRDNHASGGATWSLGEGPNDQGGNLGWNFNPFEAPGSVTLSGNTNVCTNASTNLTFTLTPAFSKVITYTDGTTNFTTGAINSSPLIIPVSTATTKTYSIVSVDVNVCVTGPVAISGTATVSIIAPPAITTNPSSLTMCNGANTTFSVVATGTSLTYQWQENGVDLANSGVYSGVTSATLSLSGASTGLSGRTYIAVVTGTCGNVTSTAATLTVNPSVSVTAFSPNTSTRCQGAGAVTTTTVATNNTSAIVYSLDATTLAFAGNSINAATGAVSYAAGWSGTTVITASAAGCNGPATTTHVVTNTPTVVINAFSPNTSTRCQGAGTVTKTTTATNSTGITYSLDATTLAFAGNGINTATGAVTYAAGWTGTTTITASAAGCNGPVTTTHTVTTTPTVVINVFSPSASTRCQGAGSVTTTTTATNSTGITYSLDATTLAFAGNSINAATGAVTYAAGWTGTTTITASAAGCNGPVTTTHVVTNTPTVIINAFTPNASTRCQGGGTVTKTTTATNSTGITYSLDATTLAFAGNSINTATGAVTYAGGWNGTTTITASAAGCNGPVTTTHVVTNTPTVVINAFSPNTSTRCQGAGTVTKTTTATNSTGITYSLDATTLAFVGNSINTATGAITYVSGWSGTTTITASATGCNGPVTTTHTVTTTPTVVINVFSPNTSTRCQGSGSVTTTTTAINSTGITYALDATTLAFAGNIINAATGAVTYAAGWSGTTTITASAAGCNGPVATTHVVTTTPTVVINAFSPNTSTRCQGVGTVTTTTTATNCTGITYSLDATTLAFAGNSINAATGAVTYAAGWTGITTITASAAGCNGPVTTAHLVTTTPTVVINAFSPNTSTRCQGVGTVTKTTTATNSTGITYSLDATTLAFAGNSINAATGAVTYATGWSGTTTITASAAGCNGPVATTHVVTTTPTVIINAFSPNSSVRCQGSGTLTTTTVATNNTSAITYSLDGTTLAFAGNNINAATGAVTYAAGWSGTTVITASAAGCNGPVTTTHTVTTTPTVVINAFSPNTSTRCQGAGTVITTTTATNSTGITYSLDATTLAFTGNGINAATGAVTYVSGWSGTTTITASAAGCNGPVATTHVVTTTPTVVINAFSPNTSTRCQGVGTVTTTTTATNSTGITYSLDVTTLAFAGNSINATTGSVTYATGWSGTTTITASAAGCNGPVTTTHVITTSPKPTFTISATNAATCNGSGSAVINITNAAGNYDVDLNGDGTYEILAQAPVANTITLSGLAVGTVINNVKIKSNNTSCESNADPINTSITAPGAPTNTTNSSAMCPDGVSTKSLSGTPAGGLWTLAAGSTASIGTIAGTTFTIGNVSGTAILRYSFAGCDADVSVITTPKVVINAFSPNTSTRCQGVGTVTTTTAATNSTGIAYSLDATTLAFAGNSIDAATGAVTYAAGWSGTTTITASAAGCNGPAATTHVVTTTPTVVINAFSPNTSTRCQGAGTVITTTTATNSTGIAYSLDATTLAFAGNSINAATGAVTYVSGWSGTTTITASAAGCNGPVATTHVVTTTPTVVINAFSPNTSTRCQGVGTVTTTTTATNSTGITYSLDATTIAFAGNSIDATTGAVIYAGGWSGTTTITASAAGCNGPVTTAHVVTTTPTPTFTINKFDAITCNGTGSVSINITNATGNYDVDLNGDGTYEILAQAPVANTITLSGLAVGTVINNVKIKSNNTSCESNADPINTSITAPGAPTNTTNSSAMCPDGVSTKSLSGTPAGGLWTLAAGSTASIGTITGTTFTIGNVSGTAILRYSFAGCDADVSVNVNPTPTMVVTNPAMVCAPATLDLTASVVTLGSTASLNYTYFTDATLLSTLASANAVATSGTYYIKGTTTAGCFDSAMVNVTVNPKPTLVVTNPGDLCNGSTTNIGLSNSDPTSTFSWTTAAVAAVSGNTNGSGSAIQQQLTNSSSAPVSVVYNVTPVANSCAGDMVSVSVTINPVAIITNSLSDSLCSGSSTNIVLNSNVSNVNYSWTSTAATGVSGNSNASGNTIIQSLTNSNNTPTNVTYAVTPTFNGCAGTPSDVVVKVYPTSNGGSVTGGSSICSGSTSGLLTLNGAVGAIKNWESSVSPFSTWGNIPNTQSTYTSGTLSETTKFRAVIASGMCATAAATPTEVIVIPTTINTGIMTGGSTVCSGSTSSNISLSGYTGTITNWESSIAPFTTWTTIANTLNNYTSGTLSETTHFRTILASGTCGTSPSAEAIVVVNMPPTISVQPTTAAPICSGSGIASYAVTASGQGVTYQWRTNGINISNGGIYSGATSAALTITNPTDVENGNNYDVLLTGTCGSLASDKVILTVNKNTTITNSPTSIIICEASGNASFVVTATGTEISYQWRENGTNLTDGGLYAGSTTSVLSLTNPPIASNGKTYDVVVTGTCNSATSSTALLTVNPKTAITSNPTNPAAICDGAGNVNFAVAATGAAITYQWRENGINITNGGIYTGATTNTLNITNPTISSNGKTYDVVVSGTCGNVTSSAGKLTVNANSVAGSISGSEKICEGSTAKDLTLVAYTGNIVRWQSSTTPFTNWANISNSTTSYSPGIVNKSTQYRAIIQSGNCAEQMSSTATIDVDEMPSLSQAGPDQALCSISTQISANKPTIGKGKWILVDNTIGGKITNEDMENTEFKGTENTTYKLVWTITNGVCKENTDTVNIKFNSPVFATVSANQTIKLGQEAALVAGGGFIYQWSPAGTLNNSNINNPTAKPSATTQYTVKVSNAAGCSDTLSTVITVDDNIEPKFPDIFTPNGDTENENWIIENGKYYTNASLDIMNRWGQIIVRKKGGDNMFWDGKNSSGVEMEVGTYFFIFKKSNDDKGIANSVSLIR